MLLNVVENLEVGNASDVYNLHTQTHCSIPYPITSLCNEIIAKGKHLMSHEMCLFGDQPTKLGNSYSCILIVSVFHFDLIVKHLSVVRVIMFIVHAFVPTICGQQC